MLKKILAVVVVLSILTVSSALAAGEGSTSTSILVQNLSADPANLWVSFYQTDGAVTGSKTASGLCGECATTFDQRYESGNPGTDPFQGAAIVESDQLIGAVVQEVRTGGDAGVNSYEAYNGVSQPATNVKAPLILRGIFSAGKTWNTVIAIQNTNTTAGAIAHVTVVFTPDPAVGLGTAQTLGPQAINPGGTWYIRQADQTGLGTQFFGSAAISSSDQNVAVVVNSGTSDGAGLIAYPTYVTGSPNVYLGGAMKNILSLGDNYFTSFTIVNMGGSPVDVTVEYQPLSGTAGAPYVTTVNTAKTIDLRSDPNITSASFYGAIKLSTTGGSIAAMINMRGDNATSGVMRYATTYSGSASGVATAFTPYLLKYINSAGYNWSTSILLQNLDVAGGPVTININYKEDPSIGTHTYASSKSVANFETVDLRYDANLTQATFYGGAKLTSVGDRPFAVVVLVRGGVGAGDALSSYLGVSQ
jgi:hypothetical protein